MTLPAGYSFTPSFNKRVAISPDGNYLAALAVRTDGAALLVRSLRDLDLKPFTPPGSEKNYFNENTTLFQQGRVAMGATWFAFMPALVDPKLNPHAAHTGVFVSPTITGMPLTNSTKSGRSFLAE